MSFRNTYERNNIKNSNQAEDLVTCSSMIHWVRNWDETILFLCPPLNRTKNVIKNSQCRHRNTMLDTLSQRLSNNILILAIPPLVSAEISLLYSCQIQE